MNRTTLTGLGGSGGLSVVIAWYWNGNYPDMPMDGPVSVAVALLLAPIFAGMGQVITALLGRVVTVIEPGES